MSKRRKRKFFYISGVFVFLLLVSAIDISTGSNAIYRLDVLFSPHVKDDRNGTEIVQFNILYSMFDFNIYREAKIENGKYIIPMQYCRGEGMISSLFKGKAKPKPGIYTLKITADGYETKLIEGKKGKIKYINLFDKYELLLPEIRLRKLNS